MHKEYLYKRFERFWHWTQAILIFTLMVTGFEIHGSFSLMGFENAVRFHNIASVLFIVLIVFAVFWHFTTGEWRQYIPTQKYLKSMVNFYLIGIFKDEPHPVKKTVLTKLNPLQKLTYAGLKILIIPVQVTSGVLYYLQPYWSQNISLPLDWVAIVHTFGALGLIAFVIGHVYLTTTGHTPLTNIKAMVTGWEEVEDEDMDEATRQKIRERKLREEK